ncbi:MAG TPA: 2-dehydropantoate 2-reductase N-terminal domain-containing protein [Spirochaetia bacterium]|nr:2-dehydropantoate 2-reductase N-terminal domain-containing protein [Spirochaetia bacterium]
MDVTLLGPGAVGTLLGGLLRLAGHNVTLVARRAAALPDRPVRIIHPSQWLLAEGLRHASITAQSARGADAWIVTLGRHHLRSLRRPDFSGLIGRSEGPVFFFNSDAAEPERLAVPPQRRRFGVTLTSAVRLQEGDVELAAAKSALVVERHPEGRKLFGGLSGYGFQILEVDDAMPFMRSFFLYQLLFLPVALCNLTLDAFLAAPQGRELARNILEEGFLTLDKAGQTLASLPVMDPRELLTRLQRKPASFAAGGEKPGRAYNSVLQAYLCSRQVESAHLNRRLVEIASSVGVHLVWNWRVLQKAGRVAGVGFYRDPGQLLQSLE